MLIGLRSLKYFVRILLLVSCVSIIATYIQQQNMETGKFISMLLILFLCFVCLSFLFNLVLFLTVLSLFYLF